MVAFSEFEINDKLPNAVLISFSVGVSAIKILARKERTHSKGFLKYIIKFLRALNTPVKISLGKTTVAN